MMMYIPNGSFDIARTLHDHNGQWSAQPMRSAIPIVRLG